METPPYNPPDSPGSSVSTRLQDEYDELLKYAVVIPDYKPSSVHGKLSDPRGVFDQQGDIITVRASPPMSGLLRDLGGTTRQSNNDEQQDDEEGAKTPQRRENNSNGTDREQNQLPDFGESPIDAHAPSNFTRQLRDEDARLQNAFPQPLFIAGNKITTREANHPNSGEREPSYMDNDPLYGTQDITNNASVPMETVYRTTIDHDVGKMETLMDQWCLDLKRNVLAEFSQAKITIEQRSREQAHREINRHGKEKDELIREMDDMKELLHTYEQSLERKDSIIANLTQAVHRQRDKGQLMRNFCQWRVHHNDVKREAFTLQIARRHYERALNRRVLSAWFSIIHCKWRNRVEKACQNKAQEICMQVTADYESKIASMLEAQESSREEIQHLHIQREKYEETMKKAFMRGVCALNMEAMSMFHGDTDPQSQGAQDVSDENLETFNSYNSEKISQSSKTIPHDAMRTSASLPSSLAATHDPPPKIVTSQGSRSMSGSSSSALRQTSGKPSSSLTTASASKSRGVTKGIMKGGDSGRTAARSISPSLSHAPMASVVVERHQAVTKQTIGQATAARYSKTDSDKFRKIAGQGTVIKNSAIHTVRVVD